MILKSSDCFEILRVINKMEVKKDIIDSIIKITGLTKRLEKVQAKMLGLAATEEKTNKEICEENPDLVIEFDNLEEQIQGMGMEIIFTIVENIPKAEQEVYKVLAKIYETTVKEVKEWEADKLITSIKDIIGNESFKRFFTSIMK